MTDNMKCPFCGTKFDIMKGISENVLGCLKCRHIVTIGVWQALIDGKEAQDALKVAIDALSKIDTFDCHGKGAIEIMAGMVSIANEALYKITSITKTGNEI